jgi:hypothetical protein
VQAPPGGDTICGYFVPEGTSIGWVFLFPPKTVSITHECP